MKQTSQSIQDLQKKFWTKLIASNPTLYVGTPQGQHFDISVPDIKVLKIRLDIYFRKNEIGKMGYITLCVMFKDEKKWKELNAVFNTTQIVNAELRPLLVYNHDAKFDLADEGNWGNAISWFNTKIEKIIKLLL